MPKGALHCPPSRFLSIFYRESMFWIFMRGIFFGVLQIRLGLQAPRMDHRLLWLTAFQPVIVDEAGI